MPKSELGARYAAADLLAFPTLGDGFGLVIQEAMCCGTPVVTTPCGGGPECITDGVDGWIVPPRDIDALVARLRACAADRDAHRSGRPGRAGARRALDLARGRSTRWCATWDCEIAVRVLYLNPFSQEVSGPDESLRTLLGALIPRGLEAHVVLPAPGPAGPALRGAGRARSLRAARGPAPRPDPRSAGLSGASGARDGAPVAGLARDGRRRPRSTPTWRCCWRAGSRRARCGMPHVLHYRGNTLDEPKWVFDALVAIWTATADQVFCISDGTADIFRRRRQDRKVEALSQPDRSDAVRARRRPRPTSAPRWAPDRAIA